MVDGRLDGLLPSLVDRMGLLCRSLYCPHLPWSHCSREVIIYSLLIPVLYCILWFSVWGGVAIRQTRQGLELEVLGENYFNDSRYFLVPGSDFCYDVPQTTLYDPNNASTPVFQNFLPGVTPVCQFDETNAEAAAYNVLYSFSFPDTFAGEGLGPTMSVIFIIYFATSSDSGSLIVNHLASDGRKKHHWVQRLFWAVTEGAVATALLTAGGSDALAAVQAGSGIAGLPFVFLICYLMQSIWVFLVKSIITEWIATCTPYVSSRR
jgi:hypothetical protein